MISNITTTAIIQKLLIIIINESVVFSFFWGNWFACGVQGDVFRARISLRLRLLQNHKSQPQTLSQFTAINIMSSSRFS